MTAPRRGWTSWNDLVRLAHERLAEQAEGTTMATDTVSVWDDDEGTYFTEGHHDPAVFMEAVNAYIDECGVRADNERWATTYEVEDVVQTWFKPHPTDQERMLSADERDPGAFAVTLVAIH